MPLPFAPLGGSRRTGANLPFAAPVSQFSAQRLAAAGLTEFAPAAKIEADVQYNQMRSQKLAFDMEQDMRTERRQRRDNRQKAQQKAVEQAASLNVAKAEFGLATAPKTITDSERNRLEEDFTKTRSQIAAEAAAALAAETLADPVANETEGGFLGFGAEPTAAALEKQKAAERFQDPTKLTDDDLNTYRTKNPASFAKFDDLKGKLDEDQKARDARAGAEFGVAVAKARKAGFDPLAGAPAGEDPAASLDRVQTEVEQGTARIAELQEKARSGAPLGELTPVLEELTTLQSEVGRKSQLLETGRAALDAQRRAAQVSQQSARETAIKEPSLPQISPDEAKRAAITNPDGSYETTQPENLAALAKDGAKVFWRQDGAASTATPETRAAKAAEAAGLIAELKTAARAKTSKVSAERDRLQGLVDRGEMSPEHANAALDALLDGEDKDLDGSASVVNRKLDSAVQDFMDGQIDAKTLDAALHAAGSASTAAEVVAEASSQRKAEDEHIKSLRAKMEGDPNDPVLSGEALKLSKRIRDVENPGFLQKWGGWLKATPIGLTLGAISDTIKAGEWLADPSLWGKEEVEKAAILKTRLGELRQQSRAAMVEDLTKRGVDLADQPRLIAKAQLEAARDAGVFETAAARGGIPQAIGEKLPFVGAILEADRLLPFAETAYKMEAGEEVDADEMEAFSEFIRFAGQDSGFFTKVTDTIASLPGFVVELVSTGGVASAVRTGGTKVLKEVLMRAATKEGKERLAKASAEAVAKKFGKDHAKKYAAWRIGSGLVQEAVRLPFASSGRIAAGFNRDAAMNGVSLDEQEGRIVAMMDKEARKGNFHRFADATVDSFIENVSERSGAYLTKIPGLSQLGAAIGKLPPVDKSRVLLTSVMRALKLKNPDKPIGQIGKFLKGANIGGTFEEMGEERIGSLLRDIYTGTTTGKWELTLPSAEDLAVEMVAFTVPGAYRGIQASAHFGKLDKSLRASDSEFTARLDSLYQSPEDEVARLNEQLQDQGVTIEADELSQATALVGKFEDSDAVKAVDRLSLDFMDRSEKALAAGDLEKASRLRQRALQVSRSKGDLLDGEVLRAVSATREIADIRESAAQARAQVEALPDADPAKKQSLAQVEKMERHADLAGALVKIAQGREGVLTAAEQEAIKPVKGTKPAVVQENGAYIITDAGIATLRNVAPTAATFVKDDETTRRQKLLSQTAAAAQSTPPASSPVAGSPVVGGSSPQAGAAPTASSGAGVAQGAATATPAGAAPVNFQSVPAGKGSVSVDPDGSIRVKWQNQDVDSTALLKEAASKGLIATISGSSGSGGSMTNEMVFKPGAGAAPALLNADESALQASLEVILRENNASTQILQRRLGYGYQQASRMIDLLEQRGFIGPAVNGSPQRQILVNTQRPTLPNDLQGAKPRYSYGSNQFDLEFESDFDKAAYIAAQVTPSKRDADYVSWAVQTSGMTPEQVRDHGKKVREQIKGVAKGQTTSGRMVIPAQPITPPASTPAQGNPPSQSSPTSSKPATKPAAGNSETVKKWKVHAKKKFVDTEQNPKLKERVSKTVDAIADALEARGTQFGGGIELTGSKKGGGMSYNPNRKSLVINPLRVAGQAPMKDGKVDQDKFKDWIERLVSEESIHAATVEVIDEIEADAAWKKLGESTAGKALQADALRAYNAYYEEKDETPPALSDASSYYEFVRMAIQNTDDFQKKITEGNFDDDGFKADLLAFLKRISDILTQRIAALPKAARAALEGDLAKVKGAMDALGIKTDATTSGQPAPTGGGQTSSDTGTPAADPGTAAVGNPALVVVQLKDGRAFHVRKKELDATGDTLRAFTWDGKPIKGDAGAIPRNLIVAETVTQPASTQDSDSLSQAASAVYQSILDKYPPPNDYVGEWHKQLVELVANPSRFHPVVQETNKKGIVIGDTVSVPLIDGVRVVSVARQGAKMMVEIAPMMPGVYGGWYDIDRVTKQDVAPIDAAANEAATSPANDKPEPTDAQKKAGNYEMGHVKIGGMDITIENPAGSVRSGTDKDGERWEVTMKSHYGYLKGTKGKDGDHIDIFIEEGTPEDYSGGVYVVNQVNADGEFDEHKAITGPNITSFMEARAAYLANYSPGWQGDGSIAWFPQASFKEWVTRRKRSAPAKTPIMKEAPDRQDKKPVNPAPSSEQTPVNTGVADTPKADTPAAKTTDDLATAGERSDGYVPFNFDSVEGEQAWFYQSLRAIKNNPFEVAVINLGRYYFDEYKGGQMAKTPKWIKWAYRKALEFAESHEEAGRPNYFEIARFDDGDMDKRAAELAQEMTLRQLWFARNAMSILDIMDIDERDNKTQGVGILAELTATNHPAIGPKGIREFLSQSAALFQEAIRIKAGYGTQREMLDAGEEVKVRALSEPKGRVSKSKSSKPAKTPKPRTSTAKEAEPAIIGGSKVSVAGGVGTVKRLFWGHAHVEWPNGLSHYINKGLLTLSPDAELKNPDAEEVTMIALDTKRTYTNEEAAEVGGVGALVNMGYWWDEDTQRMVWSNPDKGKDDAPPPASKPKQPEKFNDAGQKALGDAFEGLFSAPRIISRDIGKNSDFATPPTDEEAVNALDASRKPRFAKARKLLPGTPVGLRIDIPAFNRTGKYVVSIHAKATNNAVGQILGYDTIVRVKNPTFWANEKVALQIRDKNITKKPSATVEGFFYPTRNIPQDLDSWAAVGFDPSEHSFFYDKRTDQMLIGGDEAVSVGNSVFVKNPRYATDQQRSQALFSAPRPTAIVQADLPKDRRAAMLNAAGALIDVGVKTPLELAQRLDHQAPGGQLRQYSRSFWRLMTGFDSSLEDNPDWNSIYSEIDGTNEEAEETTDTETDPIRDLILSQDSRAKKAQAMKKLSEERGETLKQTQEFVEAKLVQIADEVARNGERPQDQFDELVSIYEQQPLFSARTSTSMENQAYSTPAPMAFALRHMTGVTPQTSVYDATAGNGMLEIGADLENSVANEIDETRRAGLTQLGIGTITSKDATSPVGVFAGRERAQVVHLNPPFGSIPNVNFEGFGIRKLEHIISLHALKEGMADNGTAAIILGATMKNQEQVKGGQWVFENYLYANYYVVDNFEVSGELYGNQGAKWPVRILVIAGRRAVPLANQDLAPKTVDRLETWDDVWARAERTRDEVKRQQDLGTDQRPAVSPDSPTGNADTENPRPIPDGQRSDDPTTQGGGRRGGSRGGQSNPGAAGTGGSGLAPGGPPGESQDAGTTDQPASGGRKPSPRMEGGSGQGTRGAADAGSGSAGDSRSPDATQPNQSNDRGVKRERKKAAATDTQVPYDPASTGNPFETLVPRGIGESLQAALAEIVANRGPIDQFVADSLDMSVADLQKAMSAEQIDGVAMAIYQMETGGALIIGDETGIGKGRQAASLIRYAILNGKIPVFFTKDPKLFSDMWGDLRDIGTQVTQPNPSPADLSVRPLVLGDAEKAQIKTPDNDVVLKPASNAKQRSVFAAARENGFAATGHNAIFATYSQIRDVNDRQEFLEWLAANDDVVVILDEAHESAGDGETSMQAAFMMGGTIQRGKGATRRQITKSGLLNGPGAMHPRGGALYLSATFAKRPDNMPVYYRTDLRRGADSFGQVVEAMVRGGVALQQAITEALAEAGQYTRRERDFTGISYDMKQVVVEDEEERVRQVDEVTSVLSSITDFSRRIKSAVEDATALSDSAQAMTDFASIVHNQVGQLLLAAKADAVVEEVVAAHRRGEKPIVALMNTMESFLQQYVTDNEIKPGQAINLNWSSLLEYALSRTLRASEKLPNGDTIITIIDPAEFGLDDAYDAVRQAARDIDVTFPVSPIDYIIQKAKASGVNVGELTGRESGIDYTDFQTGAGTYRKFKKADKNTLVNTFNGGTLDGLLLNASGSTGLSIHASEKFKDQKPRHMIIAQPALDINVFIQTLGRIKRTGIVLLGKYPDGSAYGARYSHLTLPLNSELRPAIMAARKMKSLNANTTGESDSAVKIEAEDLMNRFGNLAVAEYLNRNSDLALELGLSVTEKEDGTVEVPADIARKFTGRMALQTNQLQGEAYAEIIADYRRAVEQAKVTGDYDLEIIIHEDWDATKEAAEQIIAGTDESSIFTSSVNVEVWEMTDNRPTPSGEDMREEFIDENGSSEALDARWKAFAEEVNSRLDATEQRLTTRLAEANAKLAGLNENDPDFKATSFEVAQTSRNLVAIGVKKSRWRDTERRLDDLIDEAGKPVNIENAETGELDQGMMTQIKFPDITSTLRIAPSAFRMTYLLNRPGGRAYLSLANFKADGYSQSRSYDSLSDIKGDRGGRRERRTMLVGSPIRAFGATGGRGKVVRFKSRDGELVTGIMMPRGWRITDLAEDPRRELADANAVGRYLENLGWTAGFVESGESVRIHVSSRSFYITAPPARRTGATIFLDAELRAIVGDFRKAGNRMRADRINSVEDVVRVAARVAQITGKRFRGQDVARVRRANGLDETADDSATSGSRGKRPKSEAKQAATEAWNNHIGKPLQSAPRVAPSAQELESYRNRSYLGDIESELWGLDPEWNRKVEVNPDTGVIEWTDRKLPSIEIQRLISEFNEIVAKVGPLPKGGYFPPTQLNLLPGSVAALQSAARPMARGGARQGRNKVITTGELAFAPAAWRNGRLVVSTRTPSSVQRAKSSEVLIPSLDDLSDPNVIERVAAAVENYPQVSAKARKGGNAEAKVRSLIDTIKSNLRFLYMEFAKLDNGKLVQRARLWYAGANRISHHFATKFKLKLEQSSAIIAVFSPQKDWFQNVSLAHRAISAIQELEADLSLRFSRQYADHYLARVNQALRAERSSIVKKKGLEFYEDKVKKKVALAKKNVRAMLNKNWKEMGVEKQAIFLRMHDELTNLPSYPTIAPEGDFGPAALNADGKESKVAWGGYDTITAAIEVYYDGSVENISTQLGEQHKVRSFFNNINNPFDAQGFTTIDTHANAASLIEPLGGSSPQVKASLGGAPNIADHGLSGTYILYHQAHQELAAELSEELGVNLLPRELQSITWEAVRLLLTNKSDAIRKEIGGLWKSWHKGIVTLNELHETVLRIANGIPRPIWSSIPARTASKQGALLTDTDGARLTGVSLGRRGAYAETDAATRQTAGKSGGVPGVGLPVGRRSASSLQSAPRLGIDDPDFIEALDYLNDQLPSDEEREDLLERAGFNWDRTYTEDELRQAASGVRFGLRSEYDERLDRETHAGWNAEAAALLRSNRSGVIRDLVATAAAGEAIINPVHVKASQLLLPSLTMRALAAGDRQAMRDAEALTWAYDIAGTETARGLAARWQPHKTPEEIHRELLAKAIFTPSAADRERAKKAPTPTGKRRRIAQLEAEIEKVRTDAMARERSLLEQVSGWTSEARQRLATLRKESTREIKALREQLATLQAQKDSLQILAEANDKRLKQIEEAFKEMGVTFNDLFVSKEAVVALRTSSMVKNVLAQFNEKERLVTKMRMEAKTDRHIAKKLNISKTAVEAINERFNVAFRAQAREWVKRGFSAADLDGSVDLGTLIDEKGNLLSAARPDLTDAEVDAKVDEIFRVIVPSEEARATGALKRMPAGAKEGEFGFDLSRPEHAAMLVRAIQRLDASGMDMVYEYWINGLLSGPATHIANLAGNTGNAAWEYAVQRPVEMLVNSLITRDAAGAQFGEIKSMAKYLSMAASTAARYAKIAWQTEVSLFDPQWLNRPVSIGTTTGDKGQVQRFAIKGGKGRLIRMPSRALQFADEFAKHLFGMLEAAAQAHRLAKAEGLKGAEFDARVDRLVKTPGSPAWIAAVDKAHRITFTQDLPAPIQKMQDLLHDKAKTPWGAVIKTFLRFLFPFVRTPYNIFATGLRKTPLGTLRMAGKGIAAWRGSDPFFDSYPKAAIAADVAEQILAWTATMLLIGAAEGDPDDDEKTLLITGSRSMADNRGEDQMLSRMKGGETTILWKGKPIMHYGRYEPFATVITTVVDAARNMKAMGQGRAPKEAFDATWRGFLNQARSKTFLQGLEGLMSLIEGHKNLTDSAVKAVAQGVVWNLVRQPVRAADNYARDSRNAPWYYHAFPAGGLAEPLFDLYGRPVEKAGGPISRALVSVPTKQAPIVPADRAMSRFNLENPNDAYFPQQPTKSMFRYKVPAPGLDAKGRPKAAWKDMTPQEAAAFRRRAGQQFSAAASIPFPFGSGTATPAQMAEIKALRDKVQRETKETMFPGRAPAMPPRKSPSLAELFGQRLRQ